MKLHATASLLLPLLAAILPGCAGPLRESEPLQAALFSARSFPERLDSFKARGFNALVLSVDEETPAETIESARRSAEEARLRLYLWIDVGRNPRLADSHPEWIAGMGGHEDWRARFPKAPQPKEGQRIGVYPWVPIHYQAVLEDRKAAIVRQLRGHARGIAGVFLNGVQGAPSACGCGNDQCRWTVDYMMQGGPEKARGAPSALLVSHLQDELPEVEWIPVWVTECEKVDQDPEGTGYCGTVHCYSGECWKDSTRELEALSGAANGRLALLGATRLFRRDLPRYQAAGGWPAEALRLLATQPPRYKREPLPAARFVLVLEGAGLSGEEEKALLESASAAGARGAVLSSIPLEEGWEPRLIPVVKGGEPRTKRQEH